MEYLTIGKEVSHDAAMYHKSQLIKLGNRYKRLIDSKKYISKRTQKKFVFMVNKEMHLMLGLD